MARHNSVSQFHLLHSFRRCRMPDSPNDHPASPSLRSSSCILGCSLHLASRGRHSLPRRTHVIHKGLHAVKLGHQLSQTLLEGVELLVEIPQSGWQHLDPEGESDHSLFAHNKNAAQMCVSLHLPYSGSTVLWSWSSRSWTCVMMAYFQLSKTSVRFEHPLVFTRLAAQKEILS